MQIWEIPRCRCREASGTRSDRQTTPGWWHCLLEGGVNGCQRWFTSWTGTFSLLLLEWKQTERLKWDEIIVPQQSCASLSPGSKNQMCLTIVTFCMETLGSDSVRQPRQRNKNLISEGGRSSELAPHKDEGINDRMGKSYQNRIIFSRVW